MAIETRQVQVAKELDDLGVLLVGLVKDLKAKKPLAELASSNLPALINAMSGIDQVDDELKNNKDVAYATLGSRVGELTAALVG